MSRSAPAMTKAHIAWRGQASNRKVYFFVTPKLVLFCESDLDCTPSLRRG
jgi:hypothetical protein